MSEREDLLAGIVRCHRRVLHLEKWIRLLLQANDASEAGNFQDALEHLRKALQPL